MTIRPGLFTTMVVFAGLIGCSSDDGDSTPSEAEGFYRFICEVGEACSGQVQDGLEPGGIYLRDGKVLDAVALHDGSVCLFEQKGTYSLVAGGIRFSYPGDDESPAHSEVVLLEDGVLKNGEEPLKHIGQVTIGAASRCQE